MNKSNTNNFIFNKLFKMFIILLIILLLLLYLFRNTGFFHQKIIILPFSLHLNKKEIYLVKGEESRLFVYGINKRVSYLSTNFRVAGVDFAGRVFAYKTGKAFIIAKVDGKRLKCRVKVIDINKRQLSLRTGDSYHIKLKGPAYFAKYKSSNSSVAEVNIFGRVKAKKPGKATIRVYIKGKIIKCKIRVK